MMCISKKLALLVTVCSAVFLLSSCVTNAIGNSLSGYKQNGKAISKKASANDPMLALTGETDVILVGDFFPTVLKLYEILQTLKIHGHMNDDHGGIVQYFEKLAGCEVKRPE